MVLYQKRFVLGAMLLLFVLVLFACDSPGSNSQNGNTGVGSSGNQQATSSATAATISTPQLVTPKAASGSVGKGPLVISSPTPMLGKAGSQQVILSDRTLVINGASKQKGGNANSTLINLDLSVQNIGNKAIMNQSSFFQLIGPEGDTFGYQYNSSDTFYGPITAHTTRTGTVVFQVPTAATSSLHLLYRPEVAAETVIVLLKVS